MTKIKRCAMLLGMVAIALGAHAQKPDGDGSTTPTTDTGAGMSNSTGSIYSSAGGASGDSRSDQTISKGAKSTYDNTLKPATGQDETNASGTSGTSGTLGGNASGQPSQPGGVADIDIMKGRTPGAATAGGDSTGLTAPNLPGPSIPSGSSATRMATPIPTPK